MDEESRALFQDAVSAIQDKDDIARGRKLLIEFLRVNPDHDAAWLWMARVTGDPGKQMQCVKRALAANPANAQAQIFLERLESGESIAIQPARSRPASAARQPAAASEPRSSSGQSGLGRLIISDRVRFTSQIGKVLGMLFFLLVALVSLYMFTSSNVSGPGDVPFIIIFVGIPALIVVFLLYSAMNGRKQQVEVYENGIAQVNGAKRQIWTWDALSGLRLLQLTMTTNYRLYGVVPLGSSTQSDFKATFYDMKHKTVLKVNKSYPRHTEIGAAVVRGFSPVLLQRHMKAYRDGEVIEYGDVQISREGLQKQGMMGKSTLRWDEILQWRVENASLRIRKSNGKTVSYAINDRVNGFVLPHMMAQIKPSQGT